MTKAGCPCYSRMFHSFHPSAGLSFFRYVNPGCPGAQVVYPFHEVCYDKILRRCFKDETIDTDVLHAVFEEKGAGAWNCLGLDYGSPQPPCGNYWECIRGQEVPLVFN